MLTKCVQFRYNLIDMGCEQALSLPTRCDRIHGLRVESNSSTDTLFTSNCVTGDLNSQIAFFYPNPFLE